MQTRPLTPLEAFRELRALLSGRDQGGPSTVDGERLETVLRVIEEALSAHEAREEELRRKVAESERFRQEAAATISRYQELFEFAPDAYLVTDLMGVIQNSNRAASVLFNLRREFLRGWPLLFFLPPEDRPAFCAHLEHLRSFRDTVREWELRLMPHRGQPIDVAVTATLFGDEKSRPVGLRWLLRDVSVRKRVEEALRAEKEFVESLLNTAPVLVLVLDPAGRVLRINPYFEQLTGHECGEVLGRDGLSLLTSGADRRRMEDEFARPVLQGRMAHLVGALARKDGPARMIEWYGKPLWQADGTIAGIVVVGHDITELQEAQRRALELERLAAIGQMAAGLAHEGRNALQRSHACLAMLRWRLKEQPELLDLVERTQKAQDDLLRLYEDIREYGATIHLDLKPCDLQETWREAWRQVTALFPERDARLEADTGGLDVVCEADRFRLIQVFRNVFDNALAACADPVRVSVTLAEASLADRPAVRITVCDNGPGLDPEQRRRLFEPFYTTKVKGTGLGMAIAKRVIDAHGGQISAGDAPTHGASIVITLPRSPT